MVNKLNAFEREREKKSQRRNAPIAQHYCYPTATTMLHTAERARARHIHRL